jgi:hypothetical protein
MLRRALIVGGDRNHMPSHARELRPRAGDSINLALNVAVREHALNGKVESILHLVVVWCY